MNTGSIIRYESWEAARQGSLRAMNDADPGPAPRPRVDIERDELVMA
jgi:hypothetical protein